MPILKPVSDRIATPFRDGLIPIRAPRRHIIQEPVNELNPGMVQQSHDPIIVSGAVNIMNSVKESTICMGLENTNSNVGEKDENEQNLNSKKVGNSHGIFVGNIPLRAGPSPIKDVIAEAFNQSTRKNLHYIPPTIQKGEVVVRPTSEIIESGSKRWTSTAVGYFLGKRPYFHALEAFVKTNWPLLERVTATTNGFFFFQFKTIVAMEEIIEGGPWLFQGQPIVLQRWEPGMSLRKQKHTQIPVWVRMKHLPVEYWTDEGLSVVASGIGQPLYSDAVTKQCSRLDYARVCVMLDYNSVLPKHLVIISPYLKDGKEVPCRVDIEYEWLPQRCKECKSLGHNATSCPDLKRREMRKPVEVYVQKNKAATEVDKCGKEIEDSNDLTYEVAGTIEERETKASGSGKSGIGKQGATSNGKGLVLYNPFDLLQHSEDNEIVSFLNHNSGPKQAAHQDMSND
ncbi:UNVERIFIED_CONTAM: hypothetical protein Sradi_6834600 [Sesamum radiatum]|uniref:DUF4283 domain-containing protein n=1 Tax=Sesamum radiatum TaxID=300843 RepID=A0AAW2JPI2_SESRA